jgi:hypothetical protein
MKRRCERVTRWLAAAAAVVAIAGCAAADKTSSTAAASSSMSSTNASSSGSMAGMDMSSAAKPTGYITGGSGQSFDNAGGGKDPDFWCAFEVGEDKVIGHVPRNT